MSQPKWKCIAQLGDVNPIEYGGEWVFVDTTGVYDPEVERLFVDDDGTYRIYRYILEPCTYIDGVVSDNKYHPDHETWWADKVGNIESCCDCESLIELACSSDVLERAYAYKCIGEYEGFDNLDPYPRELTKAEVKARYKLKRFTVAI